MNTQGLVGNMLYLADGDYGARNESLPAMSLSLWLQYMLDNYATVDELAADLYDSNGDIKYQVRTKEVIPGVPSLQHLSIGDATGDNIILEWINGTLVSHHSKDYTTSAIGNTAGMIRAVSVPNEPSGIDTPNISPTLWRTYSDTLDKTYFWESATDAFFFWINLEDFNLSNNGTIMKLPLMNVDWQDRVGNMGANFENSTSFTFLECDN
ncbi:hypothetical protein LTR10_020025 [Elasticomyces elasticus]|uniref:Choloylglycine hydrolase/NAAA C-terminal domain-containing protein n=1 Tax=Exophiala sideris TaxID=1016849 RepID=A0ABR0JN06_9EURO|nr:hypothetical protein LTR10_020025 [Elasticomyces elasticus]KAK5037851.1 hypothetical protein LTS07_001318 [Exophiala sideris]KAK5043834.1 hypothetical protein LTR13_000188 [Exophiala sideris]KAK5067333.1 hypothetical protein LTR69_001320 [Exophiala sideris]KAK5182666.1 hypothetical protein LTR44_005057 [Eurotiomycetes sp. CCFEE 6388]